MLRYGHFIRDIRLERPFEKDEYLRSCTRIQNLVVDTVAVRYTSSYWFQEQHKALIQNNLETLRSYRHGWACTPKNITLLTLFRASNLDRLVLGSISFTKRKLCYAFMELCTRLRSLTLRACSISPQGLRWGKSFSFGKLERLGVFYSDSAFVTYLADRSPNLKVLHTTRQRHDPVCMLLQSITDSCRKLEVFWVGGWFELPDDSILVDLIKDLPPMKSIQLGNIFNHGPSIRVLSASLAYHCKTLEALETDHQWTSVQIQKILASCPSLRFIHGRSVLNLQDIKEDMPWVCTKLEGLQLRIGGLFDPAQGEARRAFFRQLGKMSQLRSLEIGCPDGERAMAGNYYHFEFQLGKGLEHLESLKELRQCQLSAMFTSIRQEDVEWIVHAWPKLNSFFALGPNKAGVFGVALNVFTDYNIGKEINRKHLIEYIDSDYQHIPV
ncbi:hypothetical protein BGW38_004939 [Lunasporangiospora selenospora]|uniref:Uncharacterized protein n=1 Tax=Lunasporangiospora selenospora TaxID=979761 RepID=A0A9P6G0M9_9FUNG|nr:hypothetical protein BGW38_004939 [Lunasporangiospora selenospora]